MAKVKTEIKLYFKLRDKNTAHKNICYVDLEYLKSHIYPSLERKNG